MSRTKIGLLCLLFICIFSLYFSSNYQQINQKDTKIIGIVAPMTHSAMDSIHEGVLEVSKQIKGCRVVYKNAMGDLNTQRTIIKQFKSLNADIIMPIGTGAMLMSLKESKEAHIIGLAANVSDKDMGQNAINVLDEIPLEKHLAIISKVIPNLEKFTVIYSPAEKIYPEIERLKEIAQQRSLNIQFLQAEKLSDLYSISKAIDDSSQAIFILKDHLIVSGIEGIVKEAKKKSIAVFTSDEGSVASGACLALGVSEKDIGIAGGKLAKNILEGNSRQAKQNIAIENYKLFVNEVSCEEFAIKLEMVNKLSKDLGLEYVPINKKREVTNV